MLAPRRPPSGDTTSAGPLVCHQQHGAHSILTCVLLDALPGMHNKEHHSRASPSRRLRGCSLPHAIRPGLVVTQLFGRAKTLHCVFTAFVAQMLPLPCISAAFVAQTLPLPCVATAFATQTLPLPCISTAFVA